MTPKFALKFQKDPDRWKLCLKVLDFSYPWGFLGNYLPGCGEMVPQLVDSKVLKGGLGFHKEWGFSDSSAMKIQE